MSADLAFTIGGVRTEVRFVERIEPLDPASVAVFDTVTRRLFGGGFPAERSVVLPAGERSKRWRSVEAILGRAAALGLGRDGRLLGVGGGVVCDVTGLAASLFMRGCDLALSPTTLLAMVDASLGGKTGIDFRGGKNLVGSFHPASLVLVCPAALATLPDREFHSGLAEAIKTAVIGDPALLDLLEARREAVLARDPGLLAEVVERCLRVKGEICEADPREEGRRMLLNLGHTFGHALESWTGFRGWTHGEAVAWGMGRAVALGLALGATEPGFARRLAALLAAYGFRLEAPAGLRELGPALRLDKKRRAGTLQFVVPRGAGDVAVVSAADGDVAGALGAREMG
ncbi:MAG: 3-dehydroquinate synthase [Spirochaetes bacterium]|nr:3-dehydroquinate synthase [Spirochaetota bacterium]